MTNPPRGDRLDWLLAALGLVTVVVVAGVSLLAGLFLLVPLVFVVVLLRTAVRHYFGEVDPAHRS